MIFASTKPHNTDPYPWATSSGPRGGDKALADRLGISVSYRPRPEFDQPRAHEANPILVRLRELLATGMGFYLAVDYLIEETDYDLDGIHTEYRIHAREVIIRLELSAR